MDAEGGFEMAEFQEGTLDTLMERLCNSISGFDPEWVKRCVPATEEQIQQLQDILAVKVCEGYSMRFCCNDDKLLKRVMYSSLSKVFDTISKLWGCIDRKDG